MKRTRNNYKQWIADVYHCSNIWGQKMTVEDMEIELTESRIQADHDDYVPAVKLAAVCATYWNKLCELWPG